MVMSDHHGLPHDLPAYEPNWPVPVKVKAMVMKGKSGWMWGHKCPPRGLLHKFAVGHPQATQAEAFAVALKHVQGCW